MLPVSLVLRTTVNWVDLKDRIGIRPPVYCMRCLCFITLFDCPWTPEINSLTLVASTFFGNKFDLENQVSGFCLMLSHCPLTKFQTLSATFIYCRKMDFFDLDTMVPVYVDYLGSFERSVNGIETAPDAMKELVSSFSHSIC